MKKIILAVTAFFLSITVHAGPWDYTLGQYDQFGISPIPRLVILPSGSTSGIFIHNTSTNMPMLATVDTSLSISSGGVISVNASNFATVTALNAKYDSPSGTTAQYLRGDGTLATFPSIPASQVNSDWNASNGLAQILNKPTLNAGTVTSIIAGTGLSGGTITSSGTISMPNVGTASSYSGVTTDAQGRVSAGTNRSFAYQTRALNTCYQISSTRDALVSYAVEIVTTSTLTSGQAGTVYLETFTNSGCTTGTQEIMHFTNGNVQSLGLSVTMTQTVSGNLSGIVPAGTWVKQRTNNDTSTPTFTAKPGQEVLL